MRIKKLRLVAFSAFAVFALCVSAHAQKAWTYEFINEFQKITITITPGPKGFTLSGEWNSEDFDCTIKGTYFPSTERFAGRRICNYASGPAEEPINGHKVKNQDALQITVPYSHVLARKGAKQPPTGDTATGETSTGETSTLNVSDTWDFECCDKRYKGKLTLVQDGDKVSGDFGQTTNGTTGAIQGRISGKSLTFTRRWDGKVQEYNLTISDDGKTLTGTFSGDRDTSVGVDVKATRP